MGVSEVLQRVALKVSSRAFPCAAFAFLRP
jgi:hypothetical protein